MRRLAAASGQEVSGRPGAGPGVAAFGRVSRHQMMTLSRRTAGRWLARRSRRLILGPFSTFH